MAAAQEKAFYITYLWAHIQQIQRQGVDCEFYRFHSKDLTQ